MILVKREGDHFVIDRAQPPSISLPLAQDLIGKLRDVLATNSKEAAVSEQIGEHLPDLEELCREHKEQFSTEDIDFVQKLSSVQQALKDFIYLIDNKADIRFREDAKELAIQFHEISERLEPWLVGKRAAKEQREQVQNAQGLPARNEVGADAAIHRQISKLESQAQLCPKVSAHGKLKLMGNNNGWKWYCREFPQCWHNHRVTKEESRLLN